jgi:beta-glucosidase
MARRIRSFTAAAAATLAIAMFAPPANAAAGAVPADASTGACAGAPWMDRRLGPDRRADLLLAQMTLDEKLAEMHTISDSTHSREVPANPRLCIPALLMNNGPAGVSSGGPVMLPSTALPAPIGQAATFDPEAARQYGTVEGRETTDHGRNQMEGPNVNIARVPLNGRTFEAFGEDPYLAGQIAAGNIRGIQSQGVIATVKHYAANNQEINRDTIDELIDQRTLHEIYLPAFQTAVQDGHTGSVMCAKNLVNDVHACQSAPLLNDILKASFGFNGYVISDFTSCHSTLECANNGLDVELPSATFYGDALKQAVLAGQVSVATIDEHVHRILTTMLRFGLFDRPQAATPINAAADGAVARRLAEQATVLLKNDGNILPLDADRPGSLAVIGPGAGTAVTGGSGSPDVAPLYTVSPLAAITARAGRKVSVSYAEGMPPVNLGPQPAIPGYALAPAGAAPGTQGLTASYYPNTTWTGTPAATRVEPWIDTNYHLVPPIAGLPANGWSVRWTGSLVAPVTGDYTLNLTSRGSASLYLDGTRLIRGSGGFPASTASATVHLDAGVPRQLQVDYAGGSTIELGWTAPAGADDPEIAQAVAAARAAKVAVVFVGDLEAEGVDRPGLQLPGYQDALVSAVAAANPRTVVVLNTGGPVTMPWLDQVAGVVEAWYPGEEDGNAIAATLFGDAEPGGRLPITFPRSMADTPANTPAQYPGVNGVATYSEGVFVGYRHYDAAGIAPLFPFGYGLSYTTFRLSHLHVSSDGKVTVDVTNTGRRTGSEVVQLYVDDPSTAAVPEPPHQLAGFAKLTLRPGQTGQVTLRVTARSFAHWDTDANAWSTADGVYGVSVGTSSAELPLSAPVRVLGGRIHG